MEFTHVFIYLYVIVHRNAVKNTTFFELHSFHFVVLCHRIFEGDVINVCFNDMYDCSKNLYKAFLKKFIILGVL